AGDHAPRPGAGRELAVGGVAVGRAFAVGIELIGEEAGGLIVRPSRTIGGEVKKIGGGGDFVGAAVGVHGGHAALIVVFVGDGVGRAPGGDDAAFQVVGGVGFLSEGVDGRDAATE